jgi:hypothetical protein
MKRLSELNHMCHENRDLPLGYRFFVGFRGAVLNTFTVWIHSHP